MVRYISLGMGCAIADGLRSNNCSGASLPFDWSYSTTLTCVCHMIETNFQGLYQASNWVLSTEQSDLINENNERHINKFYSGFFSVHDFKCGIGFTENCRNYTEKMQRRCYRFMHTILSQNQNDEYLCFIRDEQHFDLKDKYGCMEVFLASIERFERIMKQLNNDLRFRLLVIVESGTVINTKNLSDSVLFYYVDSNKMHDDWRRLAISWNALFEICNKSIP